MQPIGGHMRCSREEALSANEDLRVEDEIDPVY
jgi:hypothetical protein